MVAVRSLGTLLALVSWALIEPACGGKAVIDEAPLPAGYHTNGTPPAGVDPNCFALCGWDHMTCVANSNLGGELSWGADTPTGCTWQLDTSDGAHIALTMDCSSALPCMLVDGQCFILNWSVAGDPVASALGFATPGPDVWSCAAP